MTLFNLQTPSFASPSPAADHSAVPGRGEETEESGGVLSHQAGVPAASQSSGQNQTQK